MTSLAFVLGMLPMVLASGPGSASRHSIGTGVFFGMLVAITIGIVLVPFFFVLVYKMKGKVRMERILRRTKTLPVLFVVFMLAFSSCKIGKKYVRPELDLPAEIVAIAPSTISKWENGHAVPDLRQLVVVSKELGVRFSDLISVKAG